MKKAVISGDLIAYTSLSTDEKSILERTLLDFFQELQHDFQVYIRLIKGDYVECVLSPIDAFRVALMLKTFIKSVDLSLKETNDNRIKYFLAYGIRLAIGVGKLTRLDMENGIIDGEAIYYSGRLLNEQHTHNKKKIHIKQSLFFMSNDKALNADFDVIFSLVDTLVNKSTAKQSAIILYKLQGKSEREISEILDVSRSVVNRQSKSVAWHSIEKAINYYEYLMKNNEF